MWDHHYVLLQRTHKSATETQLEINPIWYISDLSLCDLAMENSVIRIWQGCQNVYSKSVIKQIIMIENFQVTNGNLFKYNY